MGVKDRAIALYNRFRKRAGLTAVKYGAKKALSFLLPGGSVIVELAEAVLECVHETANDQLIFEDRPLPASVEDLQRLEEMFGKLTDELAPLMERVVGLETRQDDLENRQDEVERVLAEAIETLDERGRNALHQIEDLARRCDRLEEQNRILLQNQRFAEDMLAVILPVYQRVVGVADYIEELRKAGVSPADFRNCLHEFQEAARAFREGHIADAAMRFQKVARSQPQSAAAATALAGALAAGQDFVAADQSIARAARLRPDDAELADLHRRVHAASLGASQRKQSGSSAVRREGPKAGDTLDGWRLDLLLGYGGWGRVFKASRGSVVRAVKVMHPELSRDPLVLERFKKEIGILYSLCGHPNLISIQDFGHAVESDCWYFVMELIEGRSLNTLLERQGALTFQQVRQLFTGVIEGLALVHARELHHRDIKPANILVRARAEEGKGRFVLADFGLAGGIDPHSRGAGHTALFAAPEQIRTGYTDPRSDVYSLAATMYYCLNFADLANRDKYKAELLPETVPAEYRALLKRCLDTDPDERPQNAGDLLKAWVEMDSVQLPHEDEHAAWVTAINLNTPEAFKKYLRGFPKGLHIAQAQQFADELTWKQIAPNPTAQAFNTTARV